MNPVVSAQSIVSRQRARAVGRLLLGFLLLVLEQVHGQIVDRPTTTQTVALRPGWNAIFLNVDPIDRDPAKLFKQLPITRVAAFLPRTTTVEFIQDPGSQAWKQEGWNVWYGPDTPEAGLSDLYSIVGGQGYLILASAATSLTVQGYVIYPQIRWRADSFNFVGFQVDPASPPTFAAWFSGSTSHQSTRRPLVYALDESAHWRPVDRLAATQIQPGTAYWVFCQGGSNYQGPLGVKGLQGKLDFGDAARSLDLRLVNQTSNPLGVRMQLASVNNLAISEDRALLNLGDRVFVPLEGTIELTPLEAAQSRSVRLVLDRGPMQTKTGTAVLVLRDDIGSLIRIPVTGKLP
jgi:hypothetical protein